MKIKTTAHLSMPIAQLQAEVPDRVANARRVVGREIAEQITDEVVGRIPNGAGWYKIYRDAISYKESPDGSKWAIAGFTNIELSDPPAETTLIEFTATAPDGQALAPYNPWPIDMIPVISGGYKDDVNIYPAGESTVAGNRDRVNGILAIARQSLVTQAQATLEDDSSQLMINGKKVVDLAYLARRLEVGYGGFPRHPHWGPAVSKARSQALKWGSTGQVKAKVDDALLGKSVGDVAEMTEAEASTYEARRASTWS